MKTLTALLLASLIGCAGQTPTGDAYTRAQRTPYVPSKVINTEARDKYYLMGYDLDGDKRIDVVLAYEMFDDNTLSEHPFQYLWLDKNGDVIARQNDHDNDGDIDSMSGDVHKLNKELDEHDKSK